VTPWQQAEIEMAIRKVHGEYESLELVNSLRELVSIVVDAVAEYDRTCSEQTHLNLVPRARAAIAGRP
jgi:hypothetical protein